MDPSVISCRHLSRAGNLGEYVWYVLQYGQSCAVSLDPVSGRKEGEGGVGPE